MRLNLWHFTKLESFVVMVEGSSSSFWLSSLSLDFFCFPWESLEILFLELFLLSYFEFTFSVFSLSCLLSVFLVKSEAKNPLLLISCLLFSLSFFSPLFTSLLSSSSSSSLSVSSFSSFSSSSPSSSSFSSLVSFPYFSIFFFFFSFSTLSFNLDYFTCYFSRLY